MNRHRETGGVPVPAPAPPLPVWREGQTHRPAPQFRTDIARTEYLSNADERLRWQASSLPADDLCTENAIMLKRFNRCVPVCRGRVVHVGVW